MLRESRYFMNICIWHIRVEYDRLSQVWDPSWSTSTVRSCPLLREILSGHLISESSQVALVPSRQSRILESPENPSFLLRRHPQQHAPRRRYQLMHPVWLLQWARCLAKLRGEKGTEAQLAHLTQHPSGTAYACEEQGWRFPWTNTSQPKMFRLPSLCRPGTLRSPEPGVLRDGRELCSCWSSSCYLWRLQCNAEAAIWQCSHLIISKESLLLRESVLLAVCQVQALSIFKRIWVLGLRKQRKLTTRDSTRGAQFPLQILAATSLPCQSEAVIVLVPVKVAPKAFSNLAWCCQAGLVLVKPLSRGESVTFSRLPSSYSARGSGALPLGIIHGLSSVSCLVWESGWTLMKKQTQRDGCSWHSRGDFSSLLWTHQWNLYYPPIWTNIPSSWKNNNKGSV